MKGLLVSVFMLTVLVGCSAIYGVTYDYDSHINFARLETYDWDLAKMEAGADAIAIKRVQNAVNKNLQSKGYRQSSAGPDFIIVTFFETQQRLAEPPDPYVVAYSPYTAPPARYYEEGNLVLDFVDPADEHLIWVRLF